MTYIATDDPRPNILLSTADKLKYVHFAGLPPIVFDLVEDPHELTNCAGDPARTSLRIEGLDRMMTWRQRFEERTLTGFLARSGKFYRDDD